MPPASHAVEYIYEDEVQVIENIPASVASREVSTVNASFGLAWDNGFEAMLWGRNITNDEYLLSAFPSVAQTGSATRATRTSRARSA